MSVPSAAKQRAESQFITQWKVANAPKIRRRRRTKRQIEEDRLKTLQAANEKQDTSQLGTSPAASATKAEARILAKPAAQEDPTPRPSQAEQTSTRPPHTPITPQHPASISDSSSSPFHFGLHSDSLSHSNHASSSHSSPSLPCYGASSSYAHTRPAGEDSILDLLNFQKSVFDRSFPPEPSHHHHQPSLESQPASLRPDLVSPELLGFLYRHEAVKGGGEAVDAGALQRPVANAPPPGHQDAWLTSTTTTTTTSSSAPPPRSTRRKRGYEATHVTARQLQHQMAARRGAAEEVKDECVELAKGGRSRRVGKKKEPAAMEQAAAALYAAHQVTSCRMVSNDAPLYSLQNVRKLMQVFQRCYWAFTPTHPSVMCDTSLRRLLTTDGGWVDTGDSLLLNVNVALAHGAHLLGATRMAEQYFERARAHLASLFDTNSYMGKSDQFSYYVSLAMNVCKQLKATDSMLYAKCLIAVNLDPTYSPYQKQKLVGEYNYYASQRQNTTNGAPAPSCWQSAASTAHSGLRTSSSSSDTRKRSAAVPFLLELSHSSSSSSPPPSSPTSYDTHSNDDKEGRYDDDAVGGEEADDEDGNWGDKAFLWSLLKKVEHIDRYVLSLQMLHEVISFRQREDPNADITHLMAYLRKLLDHMGHQLKSLKSLGSPFNTSVVLSWYGVTALYYLFSSRQQEAFLTAIKYLEHTEREHSAYCASSTIIMHRMVMDIFIMFRRYDLVRRLLVVTESFVKIHPLAQDVARGYWDAVNRHDCLS